MIIAGAGIIGLSSAWRLSSCNIPVTIFDAREAGGEASWAGAGMLAPGGEIEEASPLTDMALNSLVIYPEYVSALCEESGLDIDYRRCGAIEVALSDEEALELDARAEMQARIGIRSEPIQFHGSTHARLFPDDAVVDPRQVVTALRKACRLRGVVIREHEPVVEILAKGSGVRTTRGLYEDNGVLISAGAWSTGLVSPVHLPRAKPVRGHLISYDAPPGMLQTILRHENTYILQRKSGTIVAGTSTEHAGFDRTIDDRIIEGIRVRASQLMPELKAMQPSDKWVGFRPGIETGIPAIGRIEGTRIWTAYGHYRNGILLAPDTAERITKSVTQAH